MQHLRIGHNPAKSAVTFREMHTITFIGGTPTDSGKLVSEGVDLIKVRDLLGHLMGITLVTGVPGKRRTGGQTQNPPLENDRTTDKRF